MTFLYNQDLHNRGRHEDNRTLHFTMYSEKESIYMNKEQLLELIEEFGEVKFTRKQLNLLREILNVNTMTLVHEYNNKNSKSFKVALQKLANVNYAIANVMEEVSPSFDRNKWFNEGNKTSSAYMLWG